MPRFLFALLFVAGLAAESQPAHDLAALAPLLAPEAPELDTSAWPPPAVTVPMQDWEPPRIARVPSLVYFDEPRQLGLDLPLATAGTLSLGWQAGDLHQVQVPPALAGRRLGAVQPLPVAMGLHQLHLKLPDGEEQLLPLRLVGVTEPWPHAGVRDGLAVDDVGVPVVVRLPRWQPERQRHWALFRRQPPRSSGAAVFIGDPLAAMGSDVVSALPVQVLPSQDGADAVASALCAVAQLTPPYPRVLIWSPGLDAVGRTDIARLLTALRLRFDALGSRPRLVLLLPPAAVQPHQQAEVWRTHVQHQAVFLGWELLDGARLAGPATAANRLGDGAFSRYPVGAAQDPIRAALRELLQR